MAPRIDLAHEPALSVGAVKVLPPTREVIGAAGEREVIEPRVMQVLVALARAKGTILSRDDLTEACWEGRVVGEDAINRVISRLRRVAEGIGSSSFRVETVTKVGYRLIVQGADSTPGAIALEPRPLADRLSRRHLVAVGVAGTLAAAGAAAFLWNRQQTVTLSPEIAAIEHAGLAAYRQFTGDGDLQARGLFRRLTQVQPGYAPGWGMLGFIYAHESHYHGPDEREGLLTRARAAIASALAIDPSEPRASVASIMLGSLNSWQQLEKAIRDGLTRDPKDDVLLQLLSRTLARAGRMGDAADALQRAIARVEMSPVALFDLMIWQWAAGRLDEADLATNRSKELFPRNFQVWFGRFYINLFSGRIDEAIAQAEDAEGRPASIPDAEIERVLVLARALRSGDRRAIDAAIDFELARAHQACGYAENAIWFAAAFGRVDDAFAVANAYYLDRGFHVPSIRFPKGQGTHTYLTDRRTWVIFAPPAGPMRNDPRFAKLLGDIGLELYWQQSGTRPDYRRTA